MRAHIAAGLAIIGMTCACAAPPLADLQKTTDCMLQVLKTTRGISEAKIDTDKNSVCLEYKPSKEVLGDEINHFCLDSDLHSSETPPYLFTALFSGMVPSPAEQLDYRIAEGVSRKWENQCGVDTLLLLA